MSSLAHQKAHTLRLHWSLQSVQQMKTELTNRGEPHRGFRFKHEHISRLVELDLYEFWSTFSMDDQLHALGQYGVSHRGVSAAHLPSVLAREGSHTQLVGGLDAENVPQLRQMLLQAGGNIKGLRYKYHFINALIDLRLRSDAGSNATDSNGGSSEPKLKSSDPRPPNAASRLPPAPTISKTATPLSSSRTEANVGSGRGAQNVCPNESGHLAPNQPHNIRARQAAQKPRTVDVGSKQNRATASTRSSELSFLQSLGAPPCPAQGTLSSAATSNPHQRPRDVHSTRPSEQLFLQRLSATPNGVQDMQSDAERQPGRPLPLPTTSRETNPSSQPTNSSPSSEQLLLESHGTQYTHPQSTHHRALIRRPQGQVSAAGEPEPSASIKSNTCPSQRNGGQPLLAVFGSTSQSEVLALIEARRREELERIILTMAKLPAEKALRVAQIYSSQNSEPTSEMAPTSALAQPSFNVSPDHMDQDVLAGFERLSMSNPESQDGAGMITQPARELRSAGRDLQFHAEDGIADSTLSISNLAAQQPAPSSKGLGMIGHAISGFSNLSSFLGSERRDRINQVGSENEQISPDGQLSPPGSATEPAPTTISKASPPAPLNITKRSPISRPASVPSTTATADRQLSPLISLASPRHASPAAMSPLLPSDLLSTSPSTQDIAGEGFVESGHSEPPPTTSLQTFTDLAKSTSPSLPASSKSSEPTAHNLVNPTACSPAPMREEADTVSNRALRDASTYLSDGQLKTAKSEPRTAASPAAQRQSLSSGSTTDAAPSNDIADDASHGSADDQVWIGELIANMSPALRSTARQLAAFSEAPQSRATLQRSLKHCPKVQQLFRAIAERDFPNDGSYDHSELFPGNWLVMTHLPTALLKTFRADVNRSHGAGL